MPKKINRTQDVCWCNFGAQELTFILFFFSPLPTLKPNGALLHSDSLKWQREITVGILFIYFFWRVGRTYSEKYACRVRKMHAPKSLKKKNFSFLAISLGRGRKRGGGEGPSAAHWAVFPGELAAVFSHRMGEMFNPSSRNTGCRFPDSSPFLMQMHMESNLSHLSAYQDRCIICFYPRRKVML